MANSSASSSQDDEFDPIIDIIDYLVRCAKITFKNSAVNQPEVRTSEKIQSAHNLYNRCPVQFLLQFGKFLNSNHLNYFERQYPNNEVFQNCVSELKQYHSTESKNKRIKNRRFKALQRLQADTDYFSEKQMMYRNPLLYEQLIGQYLTDDEIKERDAVDNENLTFLSMILETVDRNEMRQFKNEQQLKEDTETSDATQGHSTNKNEQTVGKEKQWGSFDTPDTCNLYKPEIRKQSMINANERNLLREEFLNEMYTSFIEGRDINFDYNTVDTNEEYDDLEQMSQDAEDKYFDSENNDVKNLEEHMKLVEEYGRKKSISSAQSDTDPLDVYMQHLSYKLRQA